MPDHISPPSTLPPGSIVYAYLRDSGGEAQEQSIPQQQAEIEAYCKRHGLVLGNIFADEAKSGGSIAGRDQFTDLINICTHPATRPAGVLLWNFARFARDLDDSNYYKALLRKAGVTVHSLTDPIPDGVYGRVVETIIDISNEEKRRQTSRDVKRALADLARKGYATGGFPPRGYKPIKVEIGKKRDGHPRIVSQWTPDPDLSDLVKLAFQLRAEGRSYSYIEQATGNKLYRSRNCWVTFFSNKSYLGVCKCGDLEIPDHHEALIDRATWDAVQLIQAEARRPQLGSRLHPRRLANPWLLAGLAVCLYCGAPMFKDRVGKRDWDCYLCTRKRRNGWHSCEGREVNSREADKAIINAVLERVLTPDYVTELLADIRLQLSDTEAFDREEERIRKALIATERSISNLLDLAENFGALSAGQRLKERESERGRLQLDLRLLQAKREAANLIVTPEALSLALAAWRGEITEIQQVGDRHTLKNLISRFVSKVELGYNTARIWYTYPINALCGDNGNRAPPVGGTLKRDIPRISFSVYVFVEQTPTS